MSLFKKKPKIDWNLHLESLKWLNKWFKEYKKNASKVIDLEFHTFKYEGKTYTQLEIIDRIIYLTDTVIEEEKDIAYFNDQQRKVNEIFDLYKLVFWNMWW